MTNENKTKWTNKNKK